MDILTLLNIMILQMFICTEESKYIWWGRDENLQLDINKMLTT